MTPALLNFMIKMFKMTFCFLIALISLQSLAQAEPQQASKDAVNPSTIQSLSIASDDLQLSLPEKLKQQQVRLNELITNIKAEPVPEEKLKRAVLDIEELFEKREKLTKNLDRLNSAFGSEFDENKLSIIAAQINHKLYFMKLLNLLIEEKKISFISDQISESFGLKNYLCNQQYQCSVQPKPACKTLKAFYLPLIDHVFIDPNLSADEFAATLMHEVQHAFQYRYRFPLDMGFLLDQSNLENPKVNKNDILSYLSLIYETQSIWYEIQTHQPKRWTEILSLPNSAVYWSTRLGHALVSSLWHWAKLLVPGKTGTQPGLQSFNNILPIQDKINIYTSGLPAMYPAGKPNALYFNEIVLFGRPELLNLIGNIDLSFHKRVTQAVECNYYGKLNFLFETMSGNQALVAQAHDNFFTHFLGLKKFSAPHCGTVIDKDIHDSKMSPLVYWLTKNPNELPEECQKNYESWQEKHQEQARSLYSILQNSPFNLMAKGVEGGTGGFDLSPGLLFNPQLEIEPLPIPQYENRNLEGGTNEY